MEEYWRSYLENKNVNIFEFIKKAITLAATDYPSEFQNNKDKILETLFSCESMKCSGCDKCNKRTGIVISSSKKIAQEDRMSKKLIPDDFQKESIPKGISQITGIVNRQGVAEVLRIKGILDEAAGESGVICDLLAKLQDMGLSLNTLEVTGIGKTVKVLRKHASKDVSQIAAKLMKEWKDMVDEWLKNDAESVVQTTSGEQVIMQTSSVTEHKFQIDSDKENKAMGQVTTVLSTDQQSKDMYSKEVQIEPKTKRKPAAEKENRTVVPQQGNNQTMNVVKKVLPVPKPVNLAAKTQPGITSQSSKNTKGLVISDQKYCKPKDSTMLKRNVRSIEEKLEATKRKLRQGYEDVEELKKKRRIQVLAFHEVPKQGLLPKQPQRINSRQGHQMRSCGTAHWRIGHLVSTTC